MTDKPSEEVSKAGFSQITEANGLIRAIKPAWSAQGASLKRPAKAQADSSAPTAPAAAPASSNPWLDQIGKDDDELMDENELLGQDTN